MSEIISSTGQPEAARADGINTSSIFAATFFGVLTLAQIVWIAAIAYGVWQLIRG